MEELKEDMKRVFRLKSEDDPELPDYIDAGAMAARRSVSLSADVVRANANEDIHRTLQSDRKGSLPNIALSQTGEFSCPACARGVCHEHDRGDWAVEQPVLSDDSTSNAQVRIK